MNNAKIYINYKIVSKSISHYIGYDENNKSYPETFKQDKTIYYYGPDEKYFKRTLNYMLNEKTYRVYPKYKVIETNITDDLTLEVEIKEIEYSIKGDK